MTRKSRKSHARIAVARQAANKVLAYPSDGRAHPASAELQSPLRLAFTILDEFAAELAARGTPVRGAIAQRHRTWMLAGAAGAPAEEGQPELLVGRFAIPITGNDGRPFPRATLAGIVRDLYAEMGGATFSECVGIWRERDGAFYLDLSIGVEVWTAAPEQLASLIARAARELGQKFIPMLLTRPEVRWITPAGATQ